MRNLVWGALVLSGLAVGALGQDVTIRVDASRPGHPISRYLTGACIEDVNHEIYGGLYSQMIFGESFQEPAASGATPSGVSGMWRAVQTGTARLEASIEKDRPFVGAQSQRITFVGGQGDAGIENEGLNHSGLAFHKDKPYDGYLWLRAKQPTSIIVSLESRDGSHTYARHTLTVSGDDWKRYDFALTPNADEESGRFAIRLSAPGSIDVGHAFLEPGEWGRFKGLPDRRDVAEALLDQGITVLRYGGSMANAAEYRWKKMIGPRDRRPPYHGTWYPYASNGWGIIDFLNFCESAGFLGIPDFNIDETPQDMADFIEYVNGDANTEWGRKRAADGHPAPYHLRHLELGNEEKVNDTYYQKFEKITQAIWAKDPNVVPVVGDFQYERTITDPMHITGAASRITSLAAQKKILDLVRRGDHEVWFDVHLGTQTPSSTSVRAFKSYVDAIDQLADGAKHHVVVFEFNANTHDQLRAISNADEIAAIMRDGRVPVCLSANCLQVDGQNDNGWNQGLLFLNQTKVWLQPPGYVTQMFAKNYEPLEAETSVDGGADELRATATRSEDGKRLVLFVVNLSHNPIAAGIDLGRFMPSHADVTVQELAGAPVAVNTASDSTRIVPRTLRWKYDPKQGLARRQFSPTSVTVMAFE